MLRVTRIDSGLGQPSTYGMWHWVGGDLENSVETGSPEDLAAEPGTMIHGTIMEA